MEMVYLTLLFDYYGALLTDKQKQIFEDYYHDNLSLREIGERYQVSPQGVRDHLKRTEKLLYTYEEKLQVLATQTALEKKITALGQYIKTAEIDEKLKQILEEKINTLISEENY